MKVVAKRSFVFIFAVSVTCLLLRYAGNYCYGYSGMTQWPFTLQFVCCIIEYVMFPMMGLAWLIAIDRREDRSWASRVMTIYLIWLLVAYFLPWPSDLVLFGLRDRMMKDYGVERLREFASDVDQLPSHDPFDLNSREAYSRMDLRQTGLTQKYPFLTWMKISARDRGPSYVSELNRVVDVRWGGALSGHWGFSVALNQTAIGPSEYATQMLKVGNGVYFMRER